MEEKSLYTQKVEILGRLIKETSLTLEEALILLKEEEQPQIITSPSVPSTSPWTSPWTTTPYTQPFITTSGSATLPLTGTITYTNSAATVDLNN